MDSSRAPGQLHMKSTIDSSGSEISSYNTKDSDSTHRFDLSGFESGFFSNKIKLALSNDTSKSSKCLGRDKLFSCKVCISVHTGLSSILLFAIIYNFDEKACDERHMIVSNISQSETLSQEMSSSSRSSSRDNAQHVDDSPYKEEHRGSYFVHTESEWISTLIGSTIASFLHLMKTLLLLNEKEKVRIFDYSAVKKVMMHRNSIGVWLTLMLQNPRRDVTLYDLNYLNILSNLAETDRGRNEGMIIGKAASNYSIQNNIIEAVSSLDGLIPSMLTLNEKVIDDIATNHLISKVLDKMITRSFAVWIVFYDALFLAMLIVSFRSGVVIFVSGHNLEKTLR